MGIIMQGGWMGCQMWRCFISLQCVMHFNLIRSHTGPGESYNSGKSIWVSDAGSCLHHYQSRPFLARLAGFQTVVFVPMKSGVVELGSVKSASEEQSYVDTVRSAFGESSPIQAKAFPMIFGRELSLRGSKSQSVNISFTPK
ncbi:hypothetical protein ACFX13_036553 [Malus domestica]